MKATKYTTLKKVTMRESRTAFSFVLLVREDILIMREEKQYTTLKKVK